MNTVILIGRLTKDPELRYIPATGNAVGTFSIAVDRPCTKEKTTDFFEVVAFGKQAESVVNYLTKGKLVGVKGSVQNNNYTDKDGVKRYGTKIVAEQVQFLSPASEKSNFDKVADNYTGLEDGYKELAEEDVPF